MNRLTINTATWLNETIKTLEQIKKDAEHRGQCRFEPGDNVSNEVFINVGDILDKTAGHIKPSLIMRMLIRIGNVLKMKKKY